MKNTSNAELALLNLLAEKPRHAYEIEQVITQRNIRYWTDLGFSSIYRILTELEKRGWLDSEMRPPEGRGPARKVYRLTSEGNKAWQQAALNSLSHPERKYSSFLLGLDNLSLLHLSEAKEAIQNYLADQESIYSQLASSVKNHPYREDFFIQSFFDYLLHHLEAEIEWLREFIVKLDTHIRSVNK